MCGIPATKVLKRNWKLSLILKRCIFHHQMRAAFERGGIDAWSFGIPSLLPLNTNQHVWLLPRKVLVSNHQFYLADRKFARTIQKFKTVVGNELNHTVVEIKSTTSSPIVGKPTGLSLTFLQSSIGRMGFGVQPISAEVAKQQHVVGCFLSTKLDSKQAEYWRCQLLNKITRSSCKTLKTVSSIGIVTLSLGLWASKSIDSSN